MIDTILYNANVITLNAEQPRAEALAISMGRIIAVGSNDDILSLATDRTQRYDFDGNTVLPGLTDAHMHLEWLSRSLQSVPVYEVPTKAEALRRVAVHVEKVDSHHWITGWGWTQDVWDGVFPSAADLDTVAPENPVLLHAKSGHAAWANSVALRLAGMDASTPDPVGGEILRDAQGNPTGILLETAIELVANHIPETDTETLADYVQHAQQLMLASGLTSVHDYDNPSLLKALQVLRERGTLAMRTVKQINKDYFEAALTAGIRSHFGDDWIRIGNLKLFSDGALGPRTAHMIDPYEGQPDNYGIEVLTKEEMLTRIRKASEHGLASTVHAIGDKAVRIVLDIFEEVRAAEAQRGIPRDKLRHRIEHVQLIHPDDAHRLAELDIIASMQPIHATSDWEVATRYWGEDRSEYAYNIRLQLDSGARIALGSDAPVEPFDPFKGIHAAVTRERDGQPKGGWYPESKLTLDEALHGYTTGAAYAAGMEDRLGMLKERYLADLIVIDRDPYAIHPDELLNMNIIAAMVDGIWRYGDYA